MSSGDVPGSDPAAPLAAELAAALAPAPRCYLCGAAGEPLFQRLRDRLFAAPGEWSLRRCTACELIWLDPRPGASALPALYTDYFTHGTDASPSSSPFRDQLRAAVLDRTLGYSFAAESGPPGRKARLLALLPPVRELVQGEVSYVPAAPGARLLDVGCGDCAFLAFMRAQAWRVQGVEPDAAAAAIARGRVRGVAVGMLEDARFPDESFDVITLNHVIEHVPDPIATLHECQRILRPGGRVVVRTPNARSLARRWFGRS